MPAITWATDLHLDRGASLPTVQPGTGAMVITGDIDVAPRLIATLGAIAAHSSIPIYFVLGNHDHYGGSVGGVRDAVLAIASNTEVRWLPPAGPIDLGDGIALVGVDGWADGRVGDALTTPVRLNDDRYIAELAERESRRGKLAVKRALADADAARLEVLLQRAVALAERIVIATHVPPFVEMLPLSGHLAGAEWRPVLVCGATGAVIRRVAAQHPQHRFLVLAGHTHIPRRVTIARNLEARVGSGVERLDLFA